MHKTKEDAKNAACGESWNGGNCEKNGVTISPMNKRTNETTPLVHAIAAYFSLSLVLIIYLSNFFLIH